MTTYRTHEFTNISGTATCDYMTPVIEGFAAQCCEPTSAEIHQPPFGSVYLRKTSEMVCGSIAADDAAALALAEEEAANA